jgi:hypothetical protein
MRILVTHHIQFLSNANQILHLENGYIKFSGGFGELFNPKAIELDNLLLKNTNDTVVENENDSVNYESECLLKRKSVKNSILNDESNQIEESKSITSSHQFLNVTKTTIKSYFKEFYALKIVSGNRKRC